MAIRTWDPFEKHTQGGLQNGKFLSGIYTMVAAGPPTLGAVGRAAAGAGSAPEAVAWPIGLVQDVTLSQNKTFSRFWELGSERSFVIPGRAVGQLSFSRVMYHGPSLLRAAYAYYSAPPTDSAGQAFNALYNSGVAATQPNPRGIMYPAGYGDMFISMASDLFNQPIGLLLYLKDSNMQTFGGMYLENCYIPSHTMSCNAQGTIIQEQAMFDFERVVPVNLGGLSYNPTVQEREAAALALDI
jgi:hypothetical protein